MYVAAREKGKSGPRDSCFRTLITGTTNNRDWLTRDDGELYRRFSLFLWFSDTQLYFSAVAPSYVSIPAIAQPGEPRHWERVCIYISSFSISFFTFQPIHFDPSISVVLLPVKSICAHDAVDSC